MSISRLLFGLIGLVILLAIFGLWSGEPLEGLWRWPAAILLILVAWEYNLASVSLRIHRETPSVAALGEPVAYRITACNQSRSLLVFETQADYPAELEGDQSLQRWRLKASQSESRSFRIRGNTLGDARLGRLYWKQLGRFGLCWWTHHFNDRSSLRVEPVRLEKISRPEGLRGSGRNRGSNRPGGGVELLHLRDYQPGDSMRMIDWKASARRRKMMVRNFEPEHRLEIVILIDCGIGSRLQCGNLDRLHHYVNVSAKLTELAGLQGDRIACITYAQQVTGRVPLTGGIKALSQIRALIGGLSASNETANALQAALEVRQILKHRGLVVFLTEIEQTEAASQLIQASRLLSRKHQVLIATLEDPSISDLLTQSSASGGDAYLQLAALEYLKGKALTHDHLLRQGVAITSAPSKLLDRKVLNYYQEHRGAIVGI